MYCTKKITDDLTWVGANDRRLALFEGAYKVPNGISYNSYLLLDEKTVLFDTVDKAVGEVFFENIAHTLDGRALDYLVVHHMEPDHSATLAELILRYPDVKIICSAKIKTMIAQYFEIDMGSRIQLVKEGDLLETGRHTLTFVNAPMVHWPEVMVSYDKTDKILFSADAFGSFGALNGAIFADEVDFERDYMDEARRYYCNIVGKYGTQVQALLKKAAGLEIKMICPLHSFVWRSHISDIIDKYNLWSTYTPEEKGVMIAYASVYGHTANTAEIIACRLRDAGIKTVMYDVSVTSNDEIVAAAFRWSHLVFASTTYNAGIFVRMEEVLHDLAAHNIQNRTAAIVENGSWAPTSGGLMEKILGSCKKMTILNPRITIRSALKASQEADIDAFVEAIAETLPKPAAPKKAEEISAPAVAPNVDLTALFKFSYGLFVVSSRDGDKQNGCITNTVSQLTDNPSRIMIAVNKRNYTHDIILKTGEFNVSVLTTSVPFTVFQRFGFQSGRDVDKFDGFADYAYAANGINYITKYTNALISGKVIESHEYESHTLFIADITQAEILSGEPSVTYAYYFDHIKPKPQPTQEPKKGFVCKVCGYVYEGDELPEDYICPLCKHGAADFEPIGQ